MRPATLAVNLGFLLASFAIGVTAGRHERDRNAGVDERQPVAGSSRSSSAEPAAVAEPNEKAAAAPAAKPAAEPKSWGRVAADAQTWTAAVRADQNYGAGVVVTRSGLVLTNLHVVEGTRSVTVTPFGIEPTPAEVIDTDDDLDVALLRLARAADAAGKPRAPALQVAALGSVQSLAVGDEVLAVGSPRKMYFSVSRGMVSFPNRFLDGVEYIQTDLPINVGNSGGPLVDREGRVVGIVSFILKDSQGISFALPIDRALARFAKALEADATVASPAASAPPSAPEAEAAAAPKERRRPAPAQRAKR
jgi:S1-C subfamily serine protease